MRCAKCKKNFDEEMYSGICPKCGHFNNRQTEYDVSKYFSATFEDVGKISTSAQAARQHEQLHRAYDRHPMHQKTVTSSAGARQAGVPLGKENPYQTGTFGSAKQTGQSGAYGQKGTYANTYGGEKKKNLVTPVCIVIAVLAIAGTIAACQLKKQSLEKIYHTVDFEQETAQAGESVTINDRLVVVEKARVVDTSAVEGIPEGEKLVAVSSELLRTEAEDSGNTTGDAYIWDGTSYKMPLDDYVVLDLLYDGDDSMEDGILSEYSFYGYIRAKGEKGEAFFFVDEDAEEFVVSIEEGSKKDGVYVLHRRVSIPLRLEEGGEHE